MYLLVGNWSARPGEKGISVYEYDEENGELLFLNRSMPTAGISCLVKSANPEIVYATDETGQVIDGVPKNQIFALDITSPRKGIQPRVHIPSLGANPHWICDTFSGTHLLVGHHGGTGHISSIEVDAKGNYVEKLSHDAPHVILFRLDASLCPDKAVGVFLPAKEGYLPGQFSRTHCICRAPGKNLYILCDAGLDMVVSFTVDFKRETVILLDSYNVPRGYTPRHGVFHPSLPICYVNMEREAVLYAFTYNAKGTLSVIQKLDLTGEVTGLPISTEAPFRSVMTSGILVSPDGSRLYLGLRGINRIAVLHLEPDGRMSLQQLCSQKPYDPNALVLSPDGRFLLCANTYMKSITRFAVHADGSLEYQGAAASDVCPASLLFLQ